MLSKMEKWKSRGFAPAFFLALLLTGCSFLDFSNQADGLLQKANDEGWVAQTIKAGDFDLFSLQKGRPNSSGSLTVYIEGDGFAWLNKTTVSPDPTPTRPVGMRMAIEDPTPNKLYLARPCQFVTAHDKRNCHPRFWSTHRYSEAVIASLNSAISKVKANSGSKKLELIGYSGGGVLATLISARRQDIARLVTVAANLDTDAWTSYLEVSPLKYSVNPSSLGTRIRDVRQAHFVGGEDEVVPRQVTESYLRKIRLPISTSLREIKGFDHVCCWGARWAELISDFRAN